MEQRSTLPSPGSSVTPQPTKRRANILKKARKTDIADKKFLTKLSVEYKVAVAAMQEKKQVSRSLLPDTPSPKKRKRKSSPSHGSCPLLLEVPLTPQAWDKQSPSKRKKKMQAAKSLKKYIDVNVSTDGDPPKPTVIEVADGSIESYMFSPAQVSDLPESSTYIVVADGSIEPYMFSPAQVSDSPESSTVTVVADGSIEPYMFSPAQVSDPPESSTVTVVADDSIEPYMISLAQVSDPPESSTFIVVADGSKFLELQYDINPGSDVEEPDQGG